MLFLAQPFFIFPLVEQMGCSEVFQGNTNGAKHPRHFTSHVNFLKNVWVENMNRPEKIQITAKIEGHK